MLRIQRSLVRTPKLRHAERGRPFLTTPYQTTIQHRSGQGAWAALALWLVVSVPPFLRMPLWCDVTHYDLCAWNLLRGGVHYRDTFDTNLPGMVWLHLAVRSVFGWRSEAIRLVDLAIVSGIIALLVYWLRAVGHSRLVQLWAAVALFAFYFSTSEFSHCQRDTWMLLPALVAIVLAGRQWSRIAVPDASLTQIAGFATLEGVCWAFAFWIKPFVALPAIACLLVLAVQGARKPSRKRFAVHCAGLVAGGLLSSLAGVSWLVASGAWPYFWETFVSWSLEYARQSRGPRGWLLREFNVWLVLHPVAIVVALITIYRTIAAAWTKNSYVPTTASGFEAMFAASYLGWLIQVEFLQRSYVYHHVPPIMLAIAMLFAWRSSHKRTLVWHVAVTAFTALALLAHPMLRPQRLRLWPRCVTERAAPEIWNRLALWPEFINWQHLDRVAAYLRSRQLRDGELTCFATFASPLYLKLGLRPSTRFAQLHAVAYYLFPGRKAQVLEEMASSSQRLIVTDTGPGLLPSMTVEQAEAEHPVDPLALPPAFPASLKKEYPWTEPVVFRVGRYYVHRVTNATHNMKINVDEHNSTAQPVYR